MNKDYEKEKIERIIDILNKTEGLGKEEFGELKYVLKYCQHLLTQKIKSHA